MLKLKLQYFDYVMQRVNSLEKTLNLGKVEGKRRMKWQRISTKIANKDQQAKSHQIWHMVQSFRKRIKISTIVLM